MDCRTLLLPILLAVCFNSAAQELMWAHSLGSDVGSEYGSVIRSDAAGNIYIAGRLFDLADFDVNPGSFYYLNPPNYHSGYIAKYDASLNVQWAKELGGPEYITVHDMAISNDGSVYVTGSFKNQVNMDPQASNLTFTTVGNYDSFMAKYSSTGQLEWAHQYGTQALDQGFAVGIHPNGNVYFGGYYSAWLDLDPGPGTANAGNAGAGDGYVVAFDPQGNYVNSLHFGSSGYDQVDALGFDALGNVYITGEYHDMCDFDPSPGFYFLETANLDAFIAKYDTSMNLVWAYDIGGGTSFGSNCQAEEIVVEENGDFAITGIFWGTSQFDPVDSTALTTPNAGDCYIASYDANANFKWIKHMGQSQGTTGYTIDRNNRGEYLICGNHYDSLDINPGPGVNFAVTNGGRDAFALCLDSLGDYQWAFTFGSAGEEGIFDASFETDSTFLVTGIMSDPIDFNPLGAPVVIPTNGLQDIFIAKYAFPSFVGPTAVQEHSSEELSVFPNPASASVTISLPEGNLENVQLYDCRGRIVLQQSGQSNTTTLAVSELSAGMYFVRVRVGAHILVQKLEVR